MGDTKWTKEQEQAITTKNCNLLVAAAAGSGKTAVLVERIIRIITSEERPVDIDKLLVVTFTNAAAAEMRERIGEAISKAIDSNPNSKALQRQLILLNKANITTMHSFCLNIIKNNFHNIDLDPNFRIADGTEEILLKGETLQELFEECYEDSEKSHNKEFLDLVESYGGGRDDIKLQELILNLYEFVISSPWPENWLKGMWSEFMVSEDFDFGESKWGHVIIESIKIELNGIAAIINKCINTLHGVYGLEPYEETFKQDLKLILKLLSASDSTWNNLYEEFINNKFTTIGRLNKKSDYDKELSENIKAIRDNKIKKGLTALRDEICRFKPEQIRENLINLHPLMKELGGLVIKFMDKYEIKKRERGILDFSDLEHFALNILTEVNDKGERVPSETAVKLRENFHEVLVDEYQDSNMVQEVIINMVSKKYSETPNVFMVGDIKQSIYRFRQAEPMLFLGKYESYSLKEGSQERLIKLFKNFRSRGEIINGVNYIFKCVMSKTVGELEYNEDEALNLGASYKLPEYEDTIVGGPLELHLIEKVEALKDDEEEDETYEGEISKESFEEENIDNIQLEARVTARLIKDLMETKEGKTFKVFDKNIASYRKLEYRDIVILMRATKEYAPAFVQELGKQDIPVYADVVGGYFETIEIKTIMSLLQIIDNPLQDIPILAVLRSPIFSFTPEELIDIRLIDKNIPFYEAIKLCSESNENLEMKTKLLSFLNSFDIWREKSLHMPIDELIWYLYSNTGYFAYAGAMPQGSQRQANLRILFERARQFEQTSYKGLFNFVNFINRLKSSSGDMGSAKILGENENVVRIMSIHKSKGLEFPVVILSGTGKNFNLMDINKNILFHESLGIGPEFVDTKRRISYPTMLKFALKKKIKLETLSEEMRILYVAFTRAKEKLIITGTVKSLKESCRKWCEAIEDKGEKIPEYSILKGKNYLDWIGPAVAKHVDGEIIRDISDIEAFSEKNINTDASNWFVKTWTKNDVIDVIMDEADLTYSNINTILFEKLSKENQDSKMKEEVERRLNWRYLQKEASKIPAKLTVTELKRSQNQLFSDENTVNIFTSRLLKKPMFLEEKKGLSGAEKGTIMHFVMQHIDFNRVNSYEAVKDQLLEMIQKELLTKEHAMSVNVKKITSFFSSEIGKRMLALNNIEKDIKKETPFFMKLKASEVIENLSEKVYMDEVIILQGVIDVYFLEEDGIVLLDYKTDFATEENMMDIKNRYESQLYYYTEALERMTGLPVKEKYIYLFSNGKIIKY
ncbi:helicase-exonuclease AddAB subunit AddA [Candidatus Clostridium stratigraminis]|uniref:ATP-dependent helicase/nuclease subunit A n=1 Tax=Candidatus Clostridium stratigraminis TaxID=3381661 RepID=A0ABW8T3Z5_9CLOT